MVYHYFIIVSYFICMMGSFIDLAYVFNYFYY